MSLKTKKRLWGLLMMSPVIFVALYAFFTVHLATAFPPTVYQVRFLAGPVPSWAGGMVYPGGLNNPGNPVGTNQMPLLWSVVGGDTSGLLTVSLNPSMVCPPVSPIPVGVSWTMVSHDFGLDWFEVANSRQTVMMPAGSVFCGWQIGSDNLLGPAHSITPCTEGGPGTGGQ
jgi:hypothetical protein